jgi:prepilin-type N-terminal cleavage/methylation domain-containing protein
MSTDRRRLGRRHAFTLVEVLAALTIGALVLLAARALVTQLAESTRASLRHSAKEDSRANGERLARALAGRIQVIGDGASRFVGADHEARFSSWCNVPTGWQEPCVVTLAVVTDSQSADTQLTISSVETGPIVVRHGMSHATLIYLSSAREGGEWVQAWRTDDRAPLAIGVVHDDGAVPDTLFLRIGDRG